MTKTATFEAEHLIQNAKGFHIAKTNDMAYCGNFRNGRVIREFQPGDDVCPTCELLWELNNPFE